MLDTLRFSGQARDLIYPQPADSSGEAVKRFAPQRALRTQREPNRNRNFVHFVNFVVILCSDFKGGF